MKKFKFIYFTLIDTEQYGIVDFYQLVTYNIRRGKNHGGDHTHYDTMIDYVMPDCIGNMQDDLNNILLF